MSAQFNTYSVNRVANLDGHVGEYGNTVTYFFEIQGSCNIPLKCCKSSRTNIVFSSSDVSKDFRINIKAFRQKLC